MVICEVLWYIIWPCIDILLHASGPVSEPVDGARLYYNHALKKKVHLAVPDYAWMQTASENVGNNSLVTGVTPLTGPYTGRLGHSMYRSYMLKVHASYAANSTAQGSETATNI